MAYIPGAKLSASADAPYWGFTHPSIGEAGYDVWFAPCFVYVLASGRNDRPVKIGISSDVTRRILQFEAGNPYGLRAMFTHPVGRGVARQVEHKIHSMFAEKALGREWFELSAAEAEAPIPEMCARGDQAIAAYRDAILNDPDKEAKAKAAIEWAANIRNNTVRARAVVALEKARARRAA